MANRNWSGSIGVALILIACFARADVTPIEAAAAPRPTAADVRAAYDAGAVFVDVRTDTEWSAGHLQNARHLALDEIDVRASHVLPTKDEPVVLYCGTGRRAQIAAEQLRRLGYTDVRAMIGGYAELKAEGYPVVE